MLHTVLEGRVLLCVDDNQDVLH